MSDITAIAEVSGSLGFIAALRKRLADLNMTYATLDAICGFTPGYASKILCEEPADTQANAQTNAPRTTQRWFGPMSFEAVLGGTALKIVLVNDPKQLARIQSSHHFIARKKPMPISATHPYIVQRKTRENMRQMGQLGGVARAQKLTPQARTDSARKAAKARWSKPKVVEVVS